MTVYWRPGCPFCASLRRRLRRAHLPTREINIWKDPDAAATVRSIAHGNETVPTVVVGAHQLVNPPAGVVLDTVRTERPDLFDTAMPARSIDWAAVVQWSVVVALIVASFTAEPLGHEGASWSADGIAIVWFFSFRSLRRHRNRQSGAT